MSALYSASGRDPRCTSLIQSVRGAPLPLASTSSIIIANNNQTPSQQTSRLLQTLDARPLFYISPGIRPQHPPILPSPSQPPPIYTFQTCLSQSGPNLSLTKTSFTLPATTTTLLHQPPALPLHRLAAGTTSSLHLRLQGAPGATELPASTS
jgi:hypothetical protein